MRASKSHPIIRMLRCACAMACLTARKYSSASAMKQKRCAVSTRQQFRPGCVRRSLKPSILILSPLHAKMSLRAPAGIPRPNAARWRIVPAASASRAGGPAVTATTRPDRGPPETFDVRRFTAKAMMPSTTPPSIHTGSRAACRAAYGRPSGRRLHSEFWNIGGMARLLSAGSTQGGRSGGKPADPSDPAGCTPHPLGDAVGA